MKVIWRKIRTSGTESRDITEAVSTITWGGSVSQVARSAEISVINAPDDKIVGNMGLTISVGDSMELQEDGKRIFSGIVQTARKTGETGTVSYTCYDLLNHLLRSTGTYNFSHTSPERVAGKVCSDLNIRTGVLAMTETYIKKMMVEDTNFYDIIMGAYTKATKQTGKKYICRMDGDVLSVTQKGTVISGFVLEDGFNISEIEFEESIENMVNVVKIYDDSGNQIGEVRNTEWVRLYGIFQKAYRAESGVNEITAAENLLSGIEKHVTVRGIQGNIFCIAGNAVKVRDKAVGLSGIFWIDSDRHTWEKGIHTMSLELNFKNIMDSKEIDGE